MHSTALNINRAFIPTLYIIYSTYRAFRYTVQPNPAPKNNIMKNSDPTPVLSPANVPEWHYDSTINLADYIAAHPHQNVFRLFADTIIIDQTIQVNASIAQLPLDIRLDCNILHLVPVTNAALGDPPEPDLSGSGGPDCKSFALPGDGMTGEQGFPGGNVDICALNVTCDPGVTAARHGRRKQYGRYRHNRRGGRRSGSGRCHNSGIGGHLGFDKYF
jgi:hypothetical protein